MHERRSISLTVNGAEVTVAPGTTVAAAVLRAGMATRISMSGEPRGPLCGMGICFECRVTIDGVHHQRSCQIVCAQGMDVRTGGVDDPGARIA
jgi:D-hydroxyproline dehydrogenase subunit gamma